MQKLNVNPCPHWAGLSDLTAIRTSDGRTAILCPSCLADLETLLSDPVLIRGMLKATMTTAEVQKMRHERENVELKRKLSEAVATAWAVAGYPRHLALTAPVVM